MTYWIDSVQSLLRPLKHCCKVNPSVLPETTDPDWEFDYIDISSVSLTDGVTNKERMRFSAAPSRARKPVRKGDILVSTVRTYLKAIAAVEQSDTPQVASTGFAVLRANKGTDPRFLYRVVQSNPFVEQVMSQSTGISYPAINPSTLANIEIPLPDLATQRQIADFLDRETARIDLLIEKKQKLVVLLGEKWEARIQSEVSGENAPERTRSENPFFEAVPSGWRLQSLKSIFNLVSGFAFKSEFFRKGETDLPILVTPGSFNPNGGLYPTRDLDVGYLGEFDKRFLLKHGDMVVAMTDLSYRKLILGRCEFVDRDGMLLNQRIAKIVNLRPDVRPAFLRYAMNARSSREQVSLSAVGATVFHSSADKIRSTHILVPPVGVQNRIIDELDRHDRLHRSLVNDVNLSIDRLKEYRSAVITSAVTGQIDIATYAKSGATDRKLDAIQEKMSA